MKIFLNLTFVNFRYTHRERLAKIYKSKFYEKIYRSPQLHPVPGNPSALPEIMQLSSILLTV